MKVMKTYSFYLHSTFSCDYSPSRAAMGDYILQQVTARASEGLQKQEV